MSRIANNPVLIPQGVEIKLTNQTITVTSKQGELKKTYHKDVEIQRQENMLTFAPRLNTKIAKALAGTTRAIVNNLVQGVTQGFTKELTLVGVGYRAQVEGKKLNLILGFSHPINFDIPTGITIETPTPTNLLIKGQDKQQVGQVAANIRAYRPPEPYKGKGIKYTDEVIVIKETKKK